MKYKPEVYAQAFADALSANKESEQYILKNFLRVVKKNGDWIGIPKILRAVENFLVCARGGKMVLVESARGLPENVMERLLKTFQKEDKVKFINNHNIIAGARVTINGSQELDFSFSRKLKKLFK